MQKVLFAALLGMLLLGVGCHNGKKECEACGSSQMGAANDDCSMCPGPQTAKADGTCPKCGTKVKSQ